MLLPPCSELAKTKHVLPATRAAQTVLIPAPPHVPFPLKPANKPLSMGFYVNWDESSYASLKRNLDHLDWVITEWAHLQDSPNQANPLATQIDAPALNLIRLTRPQVHILPLVQNLVDEKWNSELLAQSVVDEPVKRALSLWFDTHSQYYPFEGELLPLSDLDYDIGSSSGCRFSPH